MAWRRSNGYLSMVYASYARGVLDDDVLPDERIWEYMDEGVRLEPEEAAEILRQRLVERRALDLMDEPLDNTGLRDVYYIHWPENIAKPIFDGLWPVVLTFRSKLDAAYLRLVELCVPIAQAVDDIEGTGATHTLKVFQELRSAKVAEKEARDVFEETPDADAPEEDNLDDL